MNLLRRENETCTFEFAVEELQLLFHILGLYPCTPDTGGKISKFEDDEALAEGQAMLDEALAAQKAESRERIRSFLNDSARFQNVKGQTRLTLTDVEIDWLLQVLNDIRVGLWLKLGSPDLDVDFPGTKPEEVRDHSVMQLAEDFQSFLLYSLELEN